MSLVDVLFFVSTSRNYGRNIDICIEESPCVGKRHGGYSGWWALLERRCDDGNDSGDRYQRLLCGA
jgi:hypothetical protein